MKEMNMNKSTLGVLLIAFLLAGCQTSIPQAENFPQGKQKKIMAVQHWGLIANDAVDQTLSLIHICIKACVHLPICADVST